MALDPDGRHPPPAGFHAATEYCPEPAHRRARSHEVSLPLSATTPSRATTPRLSPLPGSRCALALTMRLDAFLPRRSPWYRFQPGALTGFFPSELDLTEVACTSRRRLPLLRLAIPERREFDAVAGALGARPLRPRFRGSPSPGWGGLRDILPRLPPWLSWVSPPWGVPLPSSGLFGRAQPFPGVAHGPAGPYPPARSRRRDRRRSTSLSHFGKARFSGLGPCVSELQRAGKLAGLFRGCRPLRGLRPHPTRLAAGRCRTGCKATVPTSNSETRSALRWCQATSCPFAAPKIVRGSGRRGLSLATR